MVSVSGVVVDEEAVESTDDVVDSAETVLVESGVLVEPPVCDPLVGVLVAESLDVLLPEPAAGGSGVKQAEAKQAAK